MSTVSTAMVSEYAQRDGYNAARALKPIQSVEEYLGTHPEIANGDDEDRSLYRSTFKARYQQTVNEMQQAGLTYYGKTPSQVTEEAAAQEASKLTVDQWEMQSTIPNWSIAKAVASNFNTQVVAGDADRVSRAKASGAPGATWLTRYVQFATQWKVIYAAIQTQSAPYTPSSAVAEVRKARAALMVLDAELQKLVPSTPGVSKDVVQPPSPPPAPPPAIGAKSKLTTWAILAALVAAAGGAFLVFRKKDDKKKPLQLTAGGAR